MKADDIILMAILLLQIQLILILTLRIATKIKLIRKGHINVGYNDKIPTHGILFMTTPPPTKAIRNVE